MNAKLTTRLQLENRNKTKLGKLLLNTETRHRNICNNVENKLQYNVENKLYNVENKLYNVENKLYNIENKLPKLAIILLNELLLNEQELR